MADREDERTTPALMSLPEVARYLAMAERTIYDWAQTGRIPAFKLGATWRFRRSEIDAWLETQRSGPVVSPDRPPIVPPVVEPPTSWQRRQACREEIETTMRDDPDRAVFTIDRFVDDFGVGVVEEVVEQLRREKRIVVDEVKGRDGEKTRVIRRRR